MTLAKKQNDEQKPARVSVQMHVLRALSESKSGMNSFDLCKYMQTNNYHVSASAVMEKIRGMTKNMMVRRAGGEACKCCGAKQSLFFITATGRQKLRELYSF